MRKRKVNGLSTGSHMISRIPKGRSISASKAQKRYGLGEKPEVRITIQIPKAHPVKKNKVIDGAPGRVEITAPQNIFPKYITKIERIK